MIYCEEQTKEINNYNKKQKNYNEENNYNKKQKNDNEENNYNKKQKNNNEINYYDNDEFNYYDNDEFNYYTEQEEEVNKFIGSNCIEDINEKELKLGDKIVIYFYSYSQKYIYLLYPKYGEIIKNTNLENENFSLMNIQLKNNNTEYNAFHDNVCLYSKGFDYQVIKII